MLEDRGGWEGAGVFGAVQRIGVRLTQTKGFSFKKCGSVGFVEEEAEEVHYERLEAASM